ncbi:allantoicase [Lichtheimia ornata]|uniref:Allantoicase n=1 Tax=Lichtheimia ornata TaxID=688661 RepID=A0AAD7UUW5_9FUNG|nr:allantoicase [Lichtheimia ornata]KAJ8653695.1 allantoicase [Lichtheimia ornata]
MVSYKRVDHQNIKQSIGQCVDLATYALGSSIVDVTNEFFAPARSMLSPNPPISLPDKFVDTGSWMDGWESQRHNHSYDWCIIKLGFAGKIRAFDIDTSFFTGNHAPAASVEAAFCPEGDVQASSVKWTEILPKVELNSSSHNAFVLDQETPVFTHLRLNNIPDGGIARFRAYGTVVPIWPKDPNAIVDLAFIGNGARAVHVTNEHYTPGNNILLPGRGQNMGDGWQTKRSRIPGHSDHVVVRLGDKGHILKAEIDTSHFKGNFPDSILLEATNSDNEVPEASAQWVTLLPNNTKVGPHGVFYFDVPHTDKVFSHARISIIPDGGFKRLRLYGVRQGGQIPALPLAAPTIHKRNLIAEPLTTEKYKPFGDVIEADPVSKKMSGANQGTAEKYHFVADIVNNYPGHSRTNMCVFRSKPTTELPFTVRLLERHPYSSQAFMPMTHGQTRGYLVIVCLSKEDGSPDIDTMKAFIASSTQGINYRQNTWHHPMVALDGVTDFACLVHENGVPNDDCQITNVEEEVIVQLPGFHEVRIPSKI